MNKLTTLYQYIYIYLYKTTTMSINNSNEKASFTKKTQLEVMGLGLEARCRTKNYPEIHGIPRSIYYQTNNINTTERSFGMPTGALQNTFSRLTAPSALQVSSTSANDTGAGTGARTIYIEGLLYNNGKWKEHTSSITTLNGQSAVQIGSLTDWYRINKVWVNTTGSGGTNAGAIYISPLGQALTAGVPQANTLSAIITGYSNSTGGFFSIPYGKRFIYTFATNKEIRIREFFYQDFNGSGDTANMVKYEVGLYVGTSTSYNYNGAAPYTGLTDIGLNIFTTQSTADAATYYVEYVMTNADKENI